MSIQLQTPKGIQIDIHSHDCTFKFAFCTRGFKLLKGGRTVNRFRLYKHCPCMQHIQSVWMCYFVTVVWPTIEMCRGRNTVTWCLLISNDLRLTDSERSRKCKTSDIPKSNFWNFHEFVTSDISVQPIEPYGHTLWCENHLVRSDWMWLHRKPPKR